MEFLDLNRIFWNWNEKYTFHQKLCQTKSVDFIEANNFAFLCILRISNIMVEKWAFMLSMITFNEREKYISHEKMLGFKFVDLYVVFCIITFFHISYNLTGKLNLYMGHSMPNRTANIQFISKNYLNYRERFCKMLADFSTKKIPFMLLLL